MRVAIQGEFGSFSHEAAQSLVSEMTGVPCTTAADVLAKLACAQVNAAVIPIENSLAGSVIDFYDLIFEHEFVIERELQMRIRHNLIAPPGSDLACLRKVFSHPVALAQCKRFLLRTHSWSQRPFTTLRGACNTSCGKIVRNWLLLPANRLLLIMVRRFCEQESKTGKRVTRVSG